MSEDPLKENGTDLSENVFREVDRVCNSFERLWRKGERPEIGRFLPESKPYLREILIRELLSIDLKYRKQLGEEPTVFQYLRVLFLRSNGRFWRPFALAD